MKNEKSIAASKSDGMEKINQEFRPSNSALDRQRMHTQMVQNVLLIWLDNNIDDNNIDCHKIIIQLRHVVNTIKTFTEVDQCIDFLSDIDNEKVCMVISDALCQNIVPLIHDIAQLHTLFVVGNNETIYKQWTKNWPKIKGVFTEITNICEGLKQTSQQCEHNAISISFMTVSNDASKNNLDQLDCSFMYTEILKEILLTIKFEQKHIKEYSDYCREQYVENDNELVKINKFEREYYDQTPIWWYTHGCFLYPMLNRALRLMDVDIIIKMSFFINDLHHHIEKLHLEQFDEHYSGGTFTVCRGQGLSEADFAQIIKNKGGLIAFNNFLSTSTDRSVSLAFAESNQSNPDVVPILFVMTIDPSQSTAPFASITDISSFQIEKEILFSMHTVFRVCDINPMNENHHLFQVDLTLTSDNDKDLLALTDQIRKESFSNTEGWYRLGLVLFDMGYSDKAEQVYRVLFDQTMNENGKASLYHQLGVAKYYQGEYKEAIKFYQEALEIYQKILPPNHPNLATSYINISSVYCDMGEHSKALSSYEKALKIKEEILPENHPNLANLYNNMGNVYHSTGDYSKALSFHEKAIKIRQLSLPPNHPNLAYSYNNIGNVYYNIGEYLKALSYYEKSLEIQQKSLPSNHPNLATSYRNIGSAYGNMKEYSKAFSYHDKALEIRQKSLSSNHLDLAASYNEIGSLHGQIDEYTKALPYFTKALETYQKSLPPNDPTLARSYSNIGETCRNMGDYLKALSSYEKSLEIQQQLLSPNHPDMASSYNDIGNVYCNMAEYSKALPYYEKSLEISQTTLPPNDPDLATSYNNIDSLHSYMGEYIKALLYFRKSLEIQQQSLSLNHPDLASTYNNIGLIYDNMGDYSKALSSHEKALEIRQQSFPSNHPEFASCYNNIGEVYLHMHEYSKALAYFEKALNIQQETLPPNHLNFSYSYNNIGNVYSKMEDYSVACSFYERAVDIAKRALSSNHPHLQMCKNNLDRVKKMI